MNGHAEESGMKICFLGSAALGSAIGGALSEAGADVTLSDAWREHVDAMNRNDLTLREGGVDRTEVLADPQIQARGMIIEQEHLVLSKIRMPISSECDTRRKAWLRCRARTTGRSPRRSATHGPRSMRWCATAYSTPRKS